MSQWIHRNTFYFSPNESKLFQACQNNWGVEFFFPNVKIFLYDCVNMDDFLIEIQILRNVVCEKVIAEFKHDMKFLNFDFSKYAFKSDCRVSISFFEVNKDQLLDVNKEVIESDTKKIEVPKDFFNTLIQLQQEGLFSDVIIRCGTKIFKAHKIVLSAKSPVFEAMFRTPMKEAKNHEVSIEDVQPEVFQTILTHIYSDKSIQESDDVDLLFNIMAAADTYMLLELKKGCAEKLKSVVSVSNALKMLSFADLYDVELKNFAMQFVCKEYNNLKDTPEWKNLQTENPSLIIDVTTAKIALMMNNEKIN